MVMTAMRSSFGTWTGQNGREVTASKTDGGNQVRSKVNRLVMRGSELTAHRARTIAQVSRAPDYVNAVWVPRRGASHPPSVAPSPCRFRRKPCRTVASQPPTQEHLTTDMVQRICYSIQRNSARRVNYSYRFSFFLSLKRERVWHSSPGTRPPPTRAQSCLAKSHTLIRVMREGRSCCYCKIQKERRQKQEVDTNAIRREKHVPRKGRQFKRANRRQIGRIRV